jgi:hypothetical protein
VIVAAASVAAAGEWQDRADRVVIDCTAARDLAERLPFLSPWPYYEFIRQGAVEDGRTATDRAAVGTVFANAADGWLTEMLRCRQIGDVSGAKDARISLQRAATQCETVLEEATSYARISRNQSNQCLMLLQMP